MKLIKAILPTTLLLIAFSCGKKEKTIYDQYANKKTEDAPSSITEQPVTDSTSGYLANGDDAPDNPLSSSATYYAPGDTTRKFIKTADLKFRVKSVLHATYNIEDLTHQFGGFVMYTRLDSRVDNTTIVPVSPDSALETVYYTVTNTMTIRVPEKKLDSTLRSFTSLVEYLDYRTIQVEDVYLKLLTNQLTQQRVRNQQARLKKNIDSKGQHLDEMNETEEILFTRQEQADHAKIESLMLKDKMEFSTITLFIYQRQAIKRELIFNSKNVEAYDPGFGYKLKHSFKTGWKSFTAVILFFAQFWVLFVIGLIALIIFRTIRKKNK